MMNTDEIIALIHQSEKKTPVQCLLRTKSEIDFTRYEVHYFGSPSLYILFGEYDEISKIICEEKTIILDSHIEMTCRNSAIGLKDLKGIHARIEPGAIIRDHVEIGDGAVIMMGAILNIGCTVGKNTMIDMGAVLGGRVCVKDNCHIGAGAVLAGVIEPSSAIPVIVEDGVLIGANAVILEGIHIGKNAVVGAGAVVTKDVLENQVVAGVPARVIKNKDEKTISKTGFVSSLRSL